MSVVAAAVVGSSLVGVYSANKASKANTAGINKGLDQSAAIAKQARDDVVRLFDSSSKRANIGLQSALDFYKQNAQKRLQPYIQGNQAAQGIISQGATQANNAVLGLPVDMNFTANQPQVQADYSGIQGAALPANQPTFAEQEIANNTTVPVPATGQAGIVQNIASRITGNAPSSGIAGLVRGVV